jgi:hypothetical protein
MDSRRFLFVLCLLASVPGCGGKSVGPTPPSRIQGLVVTAAMPIMSFPFSWQSAPRRVVGRSA